MSNRDATARVTFVLGGARSGKTAFAERLARAESTRGRRPVYVATGEPFDAEMRARIERHRRERGPGWETVEAPLDLAGTIARRAAPDVALLVDCLTVWLANLMHAGRDLDAEADTLLESLAAPGGPVILVSNEVGWGIVPDNAEARAFRDRAGTLHQAVARRADRAYLVVAGLATALAAPDPG